MQQVVKSLKKIIFKDEVNSIVHIEKVESQQTTHSQPIIMEVACMYSNDSELFLSKLMQDYNYLFDKLITLLIKTQDEVNTFSETKALHYHPPNHEP